MLSPHEQLALQVFRPRTTIEPDGTVEGYASLFGELDAARDMVMPGAFTRTLKSRGLRRIPMLFQHDPAEPVGVWQEHGFWISRNETTGELLTRPFASPGSMARITPGPTPNDAIAFFHTHPNTVDRSGVRSTPGPSRSDQLFAADAGLPGIIQSHNGIYYFGPALQPPRGR